MKAVAGHYVSNEKVHPGARYVTDKQCNEQCPYRHM